MTIDELLTAVLKWQHADEMIASEDDLHDKVDAQLQAATLLRQIDIRSLRRACREHSERMRRLCGAQDFYGLSDDFVADLTAAADLLAEKS